MIYLDHQWPNIQKRWKGARWLPGLDISSSAWTCANPWLLWNTVPQNRALLSIVIFTHFVQKLTRRDILQDFSVAPLQRQGWARSTCCWRKAPTISRCPTPPSPHCREATRASFLGKTSLLGSLQCWGWEHLPMKDSFLHQTMLPPDPLKLLPAFPVSFVQHTKDTVLVYVSSDPYTSPRWTR